MNTRSSVASLLLLTSIAAGTASAAAPPPAAMDKPPRLPGGAPDAVLDLDTVEGAAAVGAQWRYADARPVEVAFRAAGPDRKPSGAANTTWAIEPAAGVASFDDSTWELVMPGALADRRGSGRLCFGWYRLTLTVPDRLPGEAGASVVPGSTVVLSITVDDYAEVWVDGALGRTIGQQGGAVIAGWNAPNRLVIAEDARPGQRIQVAVLAINGPISEGPENYLWIRDARIEFHGASRATQESVELRIDARDPAIHSILGEAPACERIVTGLTFGEGPVWVPSDAGGALLFSDPNENRIWRWHPRQGLSIFRDASGYAGQDVASYRQPGSNGLALDPQGRLLICEHGNRRVSRLEHDGTLTVLADHLDGSRLNSPNDLRVAADGAIYFTDPPFGLPRTFDDPRKELPFSGVYRLDAEGLRLVAADLSGPNGIALSPDGRFLYVANWDVARKIVMRYERLPDGTLARGQVFFDMTGAPGEEALDGVEVDPMGNLFVCGPGGVWVIAEDGRHLGTLVFPELPANLEWGGDDGRTLFATARSGVYQVMLGRRR